MAWQKGNFRIRVIPVVGLAAMLGYVGYVLAQTALLSDPCGIYPHQSVLIPQGTPTSRLVPGLSGQQIYVCRVVYAQAPAAGGSPAAPGLTLSYGEQVAATPCATATPGATLGVLGGTGTVVAGGNGDHTLFGPVPQGSSTPLADLCALTATATTQSGSLEYVQIRP